MSVSDSLQLGALAEQLITAVLQGIVVNITEQMFDDSRVIIVHLQYQK